MNKSKIKIIFFSNAKRTNDPDYWRIARMLRNRITNFKVDYNNNLETHKDDPKKYWRIIKDVLPGGPKSNRIINIKDDTGKTIDQDETAAFINQFFLST